MNDEIEQTRNDSAQYEELNQKNQVEMLATRMDRSKTLYDTLKFQTMAKRYDEVATSKYHIILICISRQVQVNHERGVSLEGFGGCAYLKRNCGGSA